MTNELDLSISGDEIVRTLDPLYPRVKTPLTHKNNFQLLIATILSAQCTDAQVNRVTPILFSRFPDAGKLSSANLRDLERIVKSTGFYHMKAERIKKVSQMITKQFGGEVPSTLDELIKLPGVGRKTANIVLSAGFDKIEGIAVDTHVKRLSQRIGLSAEKTPEKIEKDLMKITTPNLWPSLSLLLIFHGRAICHARRPESEKCVLSKRCQYYLHKTV